MASSHDYVVALDLIKQHEKALALLWRQLGMPPLDSRGYGIETDQRWRETARSHFEQGFMALVRSVAQPESPFEG